MAENAKLVVVLLTVMTWASGLSCPNVVLKLSAGIDLNCCALKLTGKPNAVAIRHRSSQNRNACGAFGRGLLASRMRSKAVARNALPRGLTLKNIMFEEDFEIGAMVSCLSWDLS